ncbi:hypothetical protein [Reichenbachiella versicolor]|uniref:hypothetical protein n=1 Tax=Reichenbachiella versicolor TaxID=1821036 RepID=UPI000D6EA1A0|nr:hypothetical protein [Reichenbachiella versicolor]
MYNIESNSPQNLLIIRVEGELTEWQIKNGRRAIKEEIKLLKKGFTVINDISKMLQTTQNIANQIRKIQLLLFNAGMGQIVRVVGNPVSKRQMVLNSDSIGYNAIEVESFEEAMDIATDIVKYNH